MIDDLGAAEGLEEQLDALRSAAAALLDACFLADADEELPPHVDGSLLDAVSNALDMRYPIIWTDEQAAKLNEFQECGRMHPFTCGSGNRSDAAHTAQAAEDGTDKGQLIATRRGWICPALNCDYRQFWAHDFMFNGAPNPSTHPQPQSRTAP